MIFSAYAWVTSSNINFYLYITKEPTGAPLNVTVYDIQKTSMSFTWSLPTCGERHGSIVTYLYELRDHRTNTKTDGAVTDTTVKISKLIPFVAYTFRVAAVNVAGRGPFSQDVESKTKEDGENKFLFLILLFQKTLFHVYTVF